MGKLCIQWVSILLTWVLLSDLGVFKWLYTETNQRKGLSRSEIATKSFALAGGRGRPLTQRAESKKDYLCCWWKEVVVPRVWNDSHVLTCFKPACWGLLFGRKVQVLAHVAGPVFFCLLFACLMVAISCIPKRHEPTERGRGRTKWTCQLNRGLLLRMVSSRVLYNYYIISNVWLIWNNTETLQY